MNTQRTQQVNHAVVVLVSGWLVAVPGLAWAQAAQPGTASQIAAPDVLERVEITAEKRLTILDATPEAISVFRGSKLAEMGVTDLSDVATLVPNAAFYSTFGVSQFYLRGIGNTFFVAGGDPGVSMYADGSYIADQTSSNASLFDLQRIEVLRGPQGALYGRNATGGAINLLAAKPTDKFKAQAGVVIGDYGRKESEGFISGPVGDSSTNARFSYQLKALEGYTRNQLAGTAHGKVLPNQINGGSSIAPDYLDDMGSRAFRIQTATDLGAMGKLRLIVGYFRERDNGPSLSPLPDAVMVSSQLGGVYPTGDPSSTKSQIASHRVNVNTLQAIYEQTFGSNTLTLTGGFRRSEMGFYADSDGTEFLGGNTVHSISSKDRSLDGHLASDESGPLQWLVGASYEVLDQKADYEVALVIPSSTVGGGAAGQTVRQNLDFILGGEVRTVATAVYSDLRYAISPTLAVRGGLRYSRDEKTATEYQIIPEFGTNLKGAPRGAWSGAPKSLGLEWQADKTTLAYAKLSTGFKSGAINLGTVQTLEVKPETVKTLEFGVKTSFLDRRAALSAAVFSSKYKDMQVSKIVQTSITATNAPAATINGLELELQVKPVPAWTLGMNVGLLDPRYDEFTSTNQRVQPYVFPTPADRAVSVSGNQLANVSRAQVGLNAELAQPVGDNKTTLRADYVWRDKFFFTEFNNTDTMQKAYGLLHFSASIQPMSGGAKFYAYLKNVANTRAITSMNVASPLLLSWRTVTYNEPRHFGIGASLDF